MIDDGRRISVHMPMTATELRAAANRLNRFREMTEAGNKVRDFERMFSRQLIAAENERAYAEASALYGIAITESPRYLKRIKGRHMLGHPRKDRV